jgi:hypothetical protein
VDCLLLQHVLWNRPDLAERIYDYLLGQLAVDDGLKQVLALRHFCCFLFSYVVLQATFILALKLSLFIRLPLFIRLFHLGCS